MKTKELTGFNQTLFGYNFQGHISSVTHTASQRNKQAWQKKKPLNATVPKSNLTVFLILSAKGHPASYDEILN